LVDYLQAMLCYWLTSNAFSLVQVVFLRIPAVRQFCKISPLVNHDAQTYVRKNEIPNQQSFVEGFRESMTALSVCCSYLSIAFKSGIVFFHSDSHHKLWSFILLNFSVDHS